MDTETLKKENTKDRLAELYLQQCTESVNLKGQMAALNQKIKDKDLREGQLQRELENAERKLRTIEDSIRAGLAMLYPDAPVPSRHADQFGYGSRVEYPALSVTDEPKPEERLLVYILQEAV